MITEDYVSFEIANLLKKKGFDETCYACYEYFSSSVTMYSGWPFEYKGEVVNNSEDRIKCPTLQMAMKWLREQNKIISILHSYVTNKYKIIITQFNKFDIANLCNTLHSSNDYDYLSYEQACEAAIKYCLENLI